MNNKFNIINVKCIYFSFSWLYKIINFIKYFASLFNLQRMFDLFTIIAKKLLLFSLNY